MDYNSETDFVTGSQVNQLADYVEKDMNLNMNQAIILYCFLLASHIVLNRVTLADITSIIVGAIDKTLDSIQKGSTKLIQEDDIRTVKTPKNKVN